MSLDVDVI